MVNQVSLFDIGLQGSIADTLPKNPLDLLPKMQKALPGSHGERYLSIRGISMETALSYGLGYAEMGAWPHIADSMLINQTKLGRLVFPCTNPDGQVINLYGRAVGNDNHAHDHLPVGPKGLFNGKALNQEQVILCTDPFDCITLLQLGYKNAICIFDAVPSPKWVKAGKIILCLNPAKPTQKWLNLVSQWPQPGTEIEFFPQEALGGKTSVNEAHVAGTLDLSSWHPFYKLPGNNTAQQNKPWDEKEADFLFEKAIKEIKTWYVEKSIDWAAENEPGLIKAWDEAESQANREYANKNLSGLKAACRNYVQSVQNICKAYQNYIKNSPAAA